jgi:hypothetical protein
LALILFDLVIGQAQIGLLNIALSRDMHVDQREIFVFQHRLQFLCRYNRIGSAFDTYFLSDFCPGTLAGGQE